MRRRRRQEKTNLSPQGARHSEPGAGMVDGVVIVTDASDSGMVDIHDWRPVALSAKEALSGWGRDRLK